MLMIDKSVSGTKYMSYNGTFVPVCVVFLKNKLYETNLSAFVCQRETCPVHLFVFPFDWFSLNEIKYYSLGNRIH